MEQRKVAAVTLGCKVNMYDTEAMLGLFREAGYCVVPFEEAADVYIVNTCTVTNVGDKKSRQLLRRAKSRNPQGVVVAAGCYTQVAPKEIAEMEEVDILIGTKDRQKITAIVDAFLSQSGPVNAVSDIMQERTFEELQIHSLSERTRAFLKIQEGCDRFCTYCIIPFARGPVRSRKPSDILEEVRRLGAEGYKEIVLTGIHVASYGKDLEDTGLAEILSQVHEVPSIRRIRFSSIEPTVVTAEFMDAISKMPKICDHFHLSLQSGSDKTLKNMNRKYTSEDYRQAVDRIRTLLPDAAITTDVIVGFPGETERDFMESYDFIKELRLSQLHVFPYSPKKGTKAAAFPGQLPGAVKEERAAKMGALSQALHQQFLESHVGKEVSVLYERAVEDGVYEGHSTNYLKVYTKSNKCIENEIFRLKVQEIQGSAAFTEDLHQ